MRGGVFSFLRVVKPLDGHQHALTRICSRSPHAFWCRSRGQIPEQVNGRDIRFVLPNVLRVLRPSIEIVSVPRERTISCRAEIPAVIPVIPAVFPVFRAGRMPYIESARTADRAVHQWFRWFLAVIRVFLGLLWEQGVPGSNPGAPT